MDLEDKSILVTGGGGFLGSFVVEELRKRNVAEDKILVPRSREMDLRIWDNCVQVVKGRDLIIHLAGKGGGIGYNQKYPGSTFFDNAIMGVQLMEAARREGVAKFITIGTVCSYPKFAPIPFKEEDLWNGYPEETNAAYGLSKKMLLVQGQAYRQEYGFNSIHLLMVNLYGPRDNFDLESSHVIPALIRKFLEAVEGRKNEVTLWGSGNVSREFLYMEDAAEGIVLATEKYDKPEPVNLGSGSEITIKQLASLISELAGFTGKIIWDTSKPDGQPKRRLDVSKAKKEFGFEAKIDFKEGLKRTIKWYMENYVVTKEQRPN
jgi:GDP-L-fucose synthase